MRRALLSALLLAGCVDHQPGIEGTQSLRVELIAPADPGTPEDRLDDAARTLTVRVEALDQDNQVDTTFDGDVEVYVQFLGTVTPELGSLPLATISLNAGVSSDVDVDLPPVFGPSILWVEDGEGADATYATGTSETLWYRDPYTADISTPEDETALDALSASPLQNKQVTVSGSRYGADGRLIVTGVYAQGYTVSDCQCGPGGAPPCTTGNYDHVLVFSFSKPKDERFRDLQLGESIDGYGGGISEFNGLTEIGFPQTFVAADDPEVDVARLPPPFVLDAAFLTDTIEMERRESALVEVDNGVLCELDDDYATYKQWKLDIGQGCGAPINVITAGVIVDFDPADYVGMTIPKVVGTLRPVNIGSFNVWIMYPRFDTDLELPL
jgi:hypothetical protein